MELQNVSSQAKNMPPSPSLSMFNPREKEFIIFRKIQGALRHIPDFSETCKAILDAVMEEMGAENCSLMLKDPVSDELCIHAARGIKDRETNFYSEHSNHWKRFKTGEGIAGWVLKEGHAVLLNDVNEEPHFVKVNGLDGKVSSLICVPILEKDQVVGVFNLSHSKRGAFSNGDKLILTYISNQVGAALTSTRFFLEINEMNRLTMGSENDPLREREILPLSNGSSTFIEVGEMNKENGLFIYASEKMHRIKEIIDQIANTDVTVMIQGESGVGKEVVSRSIHLNSLRKEKPFVKVNCAAIPQELLESELFGYERGAFTGAYRQKPGKFEQAHGGTIFLDEIAEITPALQAKLLQVLQDREFSRLGGKKDIRVDVRVIGATNKNIEEAVKNGQFREDLYYRMNVVNITIPPLRERKEEILIFVEYFLDKYRKKFNKKVKPLTEQTLKLFMNHPWHGNIRELENLIQRYVVLGSDEGIMEELSFLMQKDASNATHIVKNLRPSLKEVHKEAMTRVEAEAIQKALERTNWNRKKAASILKVSYKALLYKIREYGVYKQRKSLSF